MGSVRPVVTVEACEAGKAGLFVKTVRASLVTQLGQPTVRSDRMCFSWQLEYGI
jgi:hypothetical protein